MDVTLYVYDLSKGLARQFSRSLTGVQIDAIYHTSLVFAGIEYFFGQGIHRKIPGSTHHGQPMETVLLGKTELPMDVITEYIDSLTGIYTAESYDLFLHNCNNFTQDLAIFLVGMDIPENIRTLPQKFLETPVGQMLRGQIDQSMRSMTQAPDADLPTGDRRQPMSSNFTSSSDPRQNSSTYSHSTVAEGKVHVVVAVEDVEALLKSANHSCAIIFFTSSTCPPCKIVYPAYDELAAEAGRQAVFIKIDVNEARAVASKYQISATPTFMTFIKGDKENEWRGANEATLRGNVRLLIQMAWPLHRHVSLRLPSLQRRVTEPVLFNKVPPLDKLAAKIGPLSQDSSITAIISYIRLREESGQAESPVPNLHNFANTLATKFVEVPPQAQFAVVDLVRITATDVRVSGFLAAERDHRIILTLIPPNKDHATLDYNLQVVTLQFACNLFTSPLLAEQLIEPCLPTLLRPALENLASSCLLAQHSKIRFLASALTYNMALFDHNERLESRSDRLNIGTMDSLSAALVEAVINESESKETLHGLLLALGMLLYSGDIHGPLWELCKAMDVKEALREKGRVAMFQGEPLIHEVGEELLRNGGVS